MNKKFLRFPPFIFILLVSANLAAQMDQPENTWESVLLDPAVSDHRVIHFEVPKNKRENTRIGVLKFQIRKTLAFLEFEGRKLGRGTYQLVKGLGCEELKKSYTKNRKLGSFETLYTFTTEYGEFSGEKNLKVPLESLNLDDSEVALVRVQKGKKNFIACGLKETNQQARAQ